MAENFFYWAQGIYAVIATIVLIGILVVVMVLFKKIVEIGEKLENLAEKANETAEKAKDAVGNTEKLVILSVYKVLKSIVNKKG